MPKQQSVSERMKKYWSDPKNRARQSKTMKKRWRDPAERTKLLEGRHPGKATTSSIVSKKVIDRILNRFGKNVQKVLRDCIKAELANLR